MSIKEKVKIPSESRMERLRELLTEDEDFRFPVIKLDSKRPRYELPAPTRDDPDNVEEEKSFTCVVLVARKNFYLSDEDKEAGKEPKEKRALYVVRMGKITPELIYLSPSSVRNWKGFVRECVKQESKYHAVVVEFSAEHVKSKQYAWNKVNLKLVRTLDEDEVEHIQEIRQMVDERVKEYADDSELDKIEEEALNEGRKNRDDEEPEEKHSKRSQAAIEDDDDDDDAKKKSSSKAKSKKDDDDDDDDDAKAKAKAKAAKAKAAVDDDDDDADAKAKAKAKAAKAKAAVDDDDDDADAGKKSSSKAKSKKDDDDDDDDGAKTKSSSKGRDGYPNLDDDDDDD